MKRSQILTISLKLGYLFILTPSSHAQQGTKLGDLNTDKPNFLLLHVEDLGYADMSFFPDAARDVHTPNIDRIANMVIYFTNAFSCSPIRSPSRAGII